MKETPLLDQIRVYSEALVEDLPSQPNRTTSAAAPSVLQPPKHNRGWPVTAVAAVLTLIVVGSVVWLVPLGGDTPQVDDPTVVATVPTIPDTVVPPTTVPTTPDTVVPSTTPPATPIAASMEWIEVAEGIPPIGGPSDVTHTEPFIITDGSTQRVAIVAGTDDGPPYLWTSIDGFEWQSTEVLLPAHPGGLQIDRTSDGYWLIGSDPSALWYSDDLLGGWEAINTDGLAREAPHPLRWEPSIRSAARVGEITLVVARYDAVFDWEEILGIKPGAYAEVDHDWHDGGVIRVTGITYSESGEPTTVTLRLLQPSPSAEGLTLIDEDTGETAYFFAADEQLDWLTVLGAYDFYSLLKMTPAGSEEIGPWAGGLGGPSSPQGMRLLQLNDSVIVEAGEIYRTRDGTTFLPHPETPSGPVTYDTASGYLYTSVVDGFFGGSLTEHWISLDAMNWTALDTPIELGDPFITGEMSVLHRLAGGWLIMKLDDEGNVIENHFSHDEQVWRTVDLPPMIDTDGGQTTRPPVVTWGNRVMILRIGSSWVGELDVTG